jgi:hypothetical protein
MEHHKAPERDFQIIFTFFPENLLIFPAFDLFFYPCDVKLYGKLKNQIFYGERSRIMADLIFNSQVRWIWDASKCGKPDSYKDFRKSFVLDEKPGAAAVQIAADSTFALYVNGVRVP